MKFPVFPQERTLLRPGTVILTIGRTGSPVTVTVNGSKSSTVTVPTRVTNDENAGKSFTTFNASGGTVTVLIQPTDTSKNGAVLNAFEIDRR